MVDNYGSGGQEPQYGQRSPNWQGEQQTNASPWPVYSPQGRQEPTFGAPQGGPPQYSQPPKLPGRGWPIFTLVMGAITAVIIAPIVFIAAVVSGINFDSIVDGSINVYNGGEVSVDETGTLALIPQNQTPMNHCTLTGSGEEYDIYVESDSGLVVGRGLVPGTYTVDCDVPDGTVMLAFNGDDISSLTSRTVSGLLWASAVGIAGIVLLIVGIVWLVRRNRERREVMRTHWGGGPQYYA